MTCACPRNVCTVSTIALACSILTFLLLSSIFTRIIQFTCANMSPIISTPLLQAERAVSGSEIPHILTIGEIYQN